MVKIYSTKVMYEQIAAEITPEEALQQEANWIERAQAGDTEAFSAIYERHQPMLKNYIYSKTRNPETIDDLAQETTMRVFTSLDKFENRGKGMAPYFVRIASNLISDTYRRAKHNPHNQPNWFEPDEVLAHTKQAAVQDDEIVIDEQAAVQTFQQLEGKLPSDDWLAMLKLAYLGYGNTEISEMLAINKSTVGTGLRRARIACRALLEDSLVD